MSFIKALRFLKNEVNSQFFVTLEDIETRDRWLEIEAQIELQSIAAPA
jgi:hypothetical protein